MCLGAQKPTAEARGQESREDSKQIGEGQNSADLLNLHTQRSPINNIYELKAETWDLTEGSRPQREEARPRHKRYRFAVLTRATATAHRTEPSIRDIEIITKCCCEEGNVRPPCKH